MNFNFLKDPSSTKIETCLLVIQDYRTFKVLEILTINRSEIKKIKENSYFSPTDSTSLKDKYIVKEILNDEHNSSFLMKVKVNKESKSFSTNTKFQEQNKNPYSYLRKLEELIQNIIKEDRQTQINSIIKKGSPKIAKKFGEEAVELVIEAGKFNDDLFIDEAADVLYYYILLLHERGFTIGEILEKLKKQKRKV